MNKKIRDEVRHFYHLFWRIPYSKLLGDKKVTEKLYKRFMNKTINWDNPKDLNEKIHWLKLNTDTTIWSELADKYLVRNYVKRKGLEEILIPLYEKYNSPDDIDFSQLPKSFVLKTNHGSGEVIKVADKREINEKEIKKTLRRFLNIPYGLMEGEPHYRKIQPCIVAEKYLQMPNDSFTFSLVDYKIWCFSGKPAYIWVCYNRSKAGCDIEIRDLQWGYHPEKCVFSDHYRCGGGICPKPQNLERMIEIAAILSDNFPEVRVDLYEHEGKIYFGEMTFTSVGGFNAQYSQDFLNELGGLIELPK